MNKQTKRKEEKMFTEVLRGLEAARKRCEEEDKRLPTELLNLRSRILGVLEVLVNCRSMYNTIGYTTQRTFVAGQIEALRAVIRWIDWCKTEKKDKEKGR